MIAQEYLRHLFFYKDGMLFSQENLTLAKQWLSEQRNNLHGEYSNDG